MRDVIVCSLEIDVSIFSSYQFVYREEEEEEECIEICKKQERETYNILWMLRPLKTLKLRRTHMT